MTKNDCGKNIKELAADENTALKINAGKTKSAGDSDGFKSYLNKKRKKITLEEYLEGIKSGDRVIIGRALTLIESKRRDDNEMSKIIINNCLPRSGKSVRIGITGVPGAGKSTFIESLGLFLLSLGKKVAVMAVDPSSSKSGGSLMGDKTRMERLSGQKDVFIRPSATSGFLGGVNRATREAIIITEAAGYDVILIETVGVGQSEVMVHSMVDFFLLLQIAGAGDELQGIKKGIMEMADAIAVTKSDGDNVTRAELCKKEIETALHYTLNYDEDWRIPVLTVSSLENRSIDKVWETVCRHTDIMKKNGRFESKRRNQVGEWFRTTIVQSLENEFYHCPKINDVFDNYQKNVMSGRISPAAAVEDLIKLFRS